MAGVTLDNFDRKARCSRCNRRYHGANDQKGWNIETKGGEIVDVLCPRCQTIMENTEAEINEATLVYGRLPDGRSVARPKTEEGE